MNKRHLLMLIGFIAAAWLAFFGDKSADTGAVEPAARSLAKTTAYPAAPAQENAGGSSTRGETESAGVHEEGEVRILALQPRSDLIADTGSQMENEGLFAGKVWQPPAPPKPDKPEPPPRPTAPPLPFTYLGKATSHGQTEVFLARGDEVLIVHEQDVLKNTYRVKAISPPTLSFVYLPLNQVQQLSIGVTN